MVLLLHFSMTFLSTILNETNGEKWQAPIVHYLGVGMPGVEVAMLAESICSGVCLGANLTGKVYCDIRSLICKCRRIFITKARHFLPL